LNEAYFILDSLKIRLQHEKRHNIEWRSCVWIEKI
jgi:hypothetical protein